LGIGDWGLGIGPNPQSPIPHPPSPIPNKIFLIYSIPINNINFFLNQKYESLKFEILYEK